MNLTGIAIGAATFIIIGLFHPIVVKAEYYFSKKIWPLFLIAGVIFVIASMLTRHPVLSPIFGILGFVCLWSIKELTMQEVRVKKGWAKMNPYRRY
ncbi:DUF4491 family protein [Sinanaerobacter chloroacetimidivorans]|jgi:branched-subunit amino acid transport protein|uniref:DUF4491 family protein n=1 Tax=Sinanaerobacter chloroacetimidivorans TaxID=2818044 RepID=A0A8J7W2I7_9FIRM|nr:DUF4491 family protein [Sinanaerobacter chloroacetimidivorans]MBR0597695.1 DUF4491 family protein [Sinanaerobacter chloroacetimidivorans]